MAGGTIHTFHTAKSIKLKDKRMAEKRSSFQGRVKVNFANTKEVREGIESGERDAPELPAWAESVEIDGVRFIRHKGNGRLYLPIAPNPNGSRSSAVFSGGKELTAEEKEALLYAKDNRHGDSLKWMTIAVDNITNIK